MGCERDVVVRKRVVTLHQQPVNAAATEMESANACSTTTPSPHVTSHTTQIATTAFPPGEPTASKQ